MLFPFLAEARNVYKNVKEVLRSRDPAAKGLLVPWIASLECLEVPV